MHIETKAKDGSVVPHFITALDFHVAGGTCTVIIKPFKSVASHDAGDDPTGDGSRFQFSPYPTGGNADLDAWALESALSSFDGGVIVA